MTNNSYSYIQSQFKGTCRELVRKNSQQQQLAVFECFSNILLISLTYTSIISIQ